MLRILTTLKLHFEFTCLCLVESLIKFLAFIGECNFRNAHAYGLEQIQSPEVFYEKDVIQVVGVGNIKLGLDD